MLSPRSLRWKMLEFYGTRVRHRGHWRVHRWLRERLRAEHRGDFEVTRQGLRWLLDPSDFVQTEFYWTGVFESFWWDHFSALVPEDAVVIDVGANFGYYTVMLAARMRKRGHVFAFEPSQKMYTRLTRNIALNQLEQHVTAVPVALSEEPGAARLELVTGNSGASFISKQGEEIVCDTLDRFTGAHQLSAVDAIKIDVEGSELSVLKGARETLGRFKPLIMIEFNPEALQRAGASVAELELLLQSFGYRLLEPRRKKLLPFARKLSAGEIVNIFALPPAAPDAADKEAGVKK